MHLEAPPTPTLRTAPGPMDCSSCPKPNDRATNRQRNGVWLPYMPSDPQEADIIDMNPVTPGPIAVTHTTLLNIKTRRAQLCLMEEVSVFLENLHWYPSVSSYLKKTLNSLL